MAMTPANRERTLFGDRQGLRAELDAPTRMLTVGAWYWFRAGTTASPARWMDGLQDAIDREDATQRGDGTVTRYAPAKVLEHRHGEVLIGVAGSGRTEWVTPIALQRRMYADELSDHLTAEPVDRDWGLETREAAREPHQYRAGFRSAR